MDHNSSVNQEIKRKFVDREILSTAGSLVEYILSKDDREAPFSWDDVENLYMYPEWNQNVLGENLYFPGGNEDDKENFQEEFNRLREESQELFDNEEISENTHDRNLEIIQNAEDDFNNLDTEPQEVFEWWIVTKWLYEKLQAKNEVVLTDGYMHYWGRGTTGQAILLDGIIGEICEEMEILEGQKYSWEDKR